MPAGLPVTVRVAETQKKDTWRNIRRELQRMHLTQLKLPGALATRRTETTAMQAQIFKLLGVKEPPKVWDISPAKPEARISQIHASFRPRGQNARHYCTSAPLCAQALSNSGLRRGQRLSNHEGPLARST